MNLDSLELKSLLFKYEDEYANLLFIQNACLTKGIELYNLPFMFLKDTYVLPLRDWNRLLHMACFTPLGVLRYPDSGDEFFVEFWQNDVLLQSIQFIYDYNAYLALSFCLTTCNRINFKVISWSEPKTQNYQQTIQNNPQDMYTNITRECYKHICSLLVLFSITPSETLFRLLKQRLKLFGYCLTSSYPNLPDREIKTFLERNHQSLPLLIDSLEFARQLCKQIAFLESNFFIEKKAFAEYFHRDVIYKDYIKILKSEDLKFNCQKAYEAPLVKSYKIWWRYYGLKLNQLKG